MSRSKTHDYRDSKRRLGWDVSYRPFERGKILRASGWGTGLRVGDYVLLSNGGADTRYRVTKIKYERDSPDQWHGELELAPRKNVDE